MGAALGLTAAVLFGVSDFMGGLAARRLHFLWVSIVSQGVAAVAVWASLPWTATAPTSAEPLVWGAVAGVGTAVGTLALYRGLANGQMAVAGPLSAVGSATLPAVAGFVLGDRLAPLALAGVLLALPALWLVAREGGAGPSLRAGVVEGLVAGAGFGVLLIGLGRAGDTTGLWPVATSEASSLAVLGLTYLVLRPALSNPGRPTLALAAGAGLLAVVANAAFYAATHAGLLTVAAVLTSLYPAVTVVLAALVLKERPERSQLVGLGLCACAVTAIVAG